MLRFIFSIMRHVFLFAMAQNTNSFPQPLEVEDEKKYLQKYKEGSNDARNILIEKNLRLVAHVVKKYSTSNIEPDDLISIGTIGLIKAIATFDVDRGARLATYAARCIENEVLMWIRYQKKNANEASLQEPIGTDKDGNELKLSDVLPANKESIVDEIDTKMQIVKLKEKIGTTLNPREQMVIEMRYGLGNNDELTQREIASILNISRSYISRIEKKALEKLFVEMNK